MLKRVLMLLCALVLMLPAAAHLALDLSANPSISVSYDAAAGVVHFTGTGFLAGQSYVVRLMGRSPRTVIAFSTVTASAVGAISGSIPSGVLADGLFDVQVSLVGGGDVVTVETVLRVGDIVPVAARLNPQTGAHLPIVLAIAFGLAILGMITLCYVFRSQLKEMRSFRRLVSRKKRLSNLLD